ncbi:MAG: hypothetical protein PVS3B1_36250 [Ktedonobacteraceae bacterium]
MQGRQGRGEGSMDEPLEPRFPSMNGTSKHRTLPQRPPGMMRLETIPEMPRVPRPQREPMQPGKLRRLLLILCGVLAIAAVLAGVIGYLIGLGLSSSTGPGTTTSDFLTALSNANYEQAYTDLGPAITISITQQQFTTQAEALDRCYGRIKDYSEVMDSATNQNNIQSYVYTLTRSKLSQSYQLHLRLQQSSQPDDSKWKIIDYGNSLGPTQHAPACSK